MADPFADKAAFWDAQPVPVQLSNGVGRAILARVPLSPTLRVLDFGAGTGLVCAQLAPHVAQVIAVDVSEAMLAKLRAKPELQGKVEARCQDLLTTPLDAPVDLVVSAMAMHHVQDTAALFRAFHQSLVPGGRVALADLDLEDGTFHAPGAEGVYHAGFAREALTVALTQAGFTDVEFTKACDVTKEGGTYAVFLVTATRT